MNWTPTFVGVVFLSCHATQSGRAENEKIPRPRLGMTWFCRRGVPKPTSICIKTNINPR